MSDVRHAIKDEAAAAAVLLANMRDVVGDDEDAVAGLVEGETGLFEAIARAVNRLAEIDAHVDALTGLVKQYRDRQARLENQSELIRAAIGLAMSMTELKKLELPQATISRKPTPAKAIITEEADVPPTFFVPQPPKLDKKALLDALKSGQSVPGATLSNGSETIAIRRS